jgi:hypothetical protein
MYILLFMRINSSEDDDVFLELNENRKMQNAQED